MNDSDGIPVSECPGYHLGAGGGGTTNMSGLFLVVSLHAKPGKEDKFRRDLIPLVEIRERRRTTSATSTL